MEGIAHENTLDNDVFTNVDKNKTVPKLNVTHKMKTTTSNNRKELHKEPNKI